MISHTTSGCADYYSCFYFCFYSDCRAESGEDSYCGFVELPVSSALLLACDP